MAPKSSTHLATWHTVYRIHVLDGKASLCPGSGSTSERKDETHQDENGEEYDHNGGRDEQLLAGEHGGREQEHQREADGTSQASVGNDELVLEGEWDGSEPVDDLGQDKDAWAERQTQKWTMRPGYVMVPPVFCAPWMGPSI